MLVGRRKPEKVGRIGAVGCCYEVGGRDAAGHEHIRTPVVALESEEGKVIGFTGASRFTVSLPAQSRSLHLVDESRAGETSAGVAVCVGDAVGGSAHECDVTGCRAAANSVASEGARAIAVVSGYHRSQRHQAVDEGSRGIADYRGIVLVLHRDDDNVVILLTSRSGGHMEYRSRGEGEAQH